MINTLQFWLKVKEEFISDGGRYLCRCSTFNKCWIVDYNDLIYSLARIFLAHKYYENFWVGRRSNNPWDSGQGLFLLAYSRSTINFEESDKKHREIRLDFIEWNIKRLS